MNFYQKKELYLKGARKFFPDLDFSSSFSMYSGELDAPNSAKVSVKTKSFNHADIGTKIIELAHYTSLDSLFNIINSKTIRLYNCDNLNDSQELIFAVNKFKLPFKEDEIIDFRRQHFVFSSCKIENENSEDFNMWRLYGQNGKGVCIHFELEKEFENWSGIIGNEVQYIDDLYTNKLTEFFKFHFSFQKEYKIFQNTPNFIPMLLLFNKEKIWSIENEFRILANCPFNKYNSKLPSLIGNSYSPWLAKTLKHTLNSSGNMVSYLEIPIEVDPKIKKVVNIEGKKINILDRYPRLKIKRVILGYQISEQVRCNIVSSLIRREIPLGIEVMNSKFSS